MNNGIFSLNTAKQSYCEIALHQRTVWCLKVQATDIYHNLAGENSLKDVFQGCIELLAMSCLRVNTLRSFIQYHRAMIYYLYGWCG